MIQGSKIYEDFEEAGGTGIMSQELSDTITYKGVRLSEVPGMAAQIIALQAKIAELERHVDGATNDWATAVREKHEMMAERDGALDQLTAMRGGARAASIDTPWAEEADMKQQIVALQQQISRLTETYEEAVLANSRERDTLKRENEALRQSLREALEGMVAFEARALSHHRHREPLSVALDMRVMIDKIINVLRRAALDAGSKEQG